MHSPIFCFLDPGLIDYDSHHYSVTNSILNSITKMKMKAILLGQKKCTFSFDNVIFCKTYTKNYWWTYKSKGKTLLSNLSFFVNTIKKIYKFRFNRDSIIFCPSFTYRQLLALALISIIFKKPKKILLFRYEKTFYEGQYSKLAFKIFNFLDIKYKNIFFTSDSELLANDLNLIKNLLNPGFEYYLPNPHSNESFNQAPFKLCNIKNGLTIGANIGNCRLEKGILQTLKAIQLLKLHRSNLYNKLTFIICSNTKERDTKLILQKFKGSFQNDPNIIFIEETLPRTEYLNLLSQLDVVLLPYDNLIYRYRTSGIFSEALGMGKITIVSEGTYSNYESEKFIDAHISCDAKNPWSIVQALETAVQNYDAYYKASLERMTQWINNHNPDLFVEKLLTLKHSKKSLKYKSLGIIYPWYLSENSNSGAQIKFSLMLNHLRSIFKTVSVVSPEGGNTQIVKYSPTMILEKKLIKSTKTQNVTIKIQTQISKVLFNLIRFSSLLIGMWKKTKDDQSFVIIEFIFKKKATFKFINAIKYLARENDVIICEYPFLSIIAHYYCSLYNKKLIISSLDLYKNIFNNKLSQLIYILQERRLYKLGHAVTSCNFHEADHIKKFYNSNTFFIPIAISFDQAHLQKTNEDLEIENFINFIERSNAKICLFVGAHHGPNYVAAKFIEELASYYYFHDNLVQFIIVGNIYKKEIVTDGTMNLYKTGFIDNHYLDMLYKAADLVLVPLLENKCFISGVSVKTIEAFKYKKCVVGTNAAFRSYNVQNNYHCIIENNPEKYLDVIANLIYDQKKINQIGSNAYRFAKQYDYKTVYSKYNEIINDL